MKEKCKKQQKKNKPRQKEQGGAEAKLKELLFVMGSDK